MQSGWDYLTERRDWAARRFRHRVNLSLCHVEQVGGDNNGGYSGDGGGNNDTCRLADTEPRYKMNIRTLFEKDINSTFLRNRWGLPWM